MLDELPIQRDRFRASPAYLEQLGMFQQRINDREIAQRDKLCVLEAMKMQTTLYAQTDGVVEEIAAHIGDRVQFAEFRNNVPFFRKTS